MEKYDDSKVMGTQGKGTIRYADGGVFRGRIRMRFHPHTYKTTLYKIKGEYVSNHRKSQDFLFENIWTCYCRNLQHFRKVLSIHIRTDYNMLNVPIWNHM